MPDANCLSNFEHEHVLCFGGLFTFVYEKGAIYKKNANLYMKFGKGTTESF